jgi:hypothetical protein
MRNQPSSPTQQPTWIQFVDPRQTLPTGLETNHRQTQRHKVFASIPRALVAVCALAIAGCQQTAAPEPAASSASAAASLPSDAPPLASVAQSPTANEPVPAAESIPVEESIPASESSDSAALANNESQTPGSDATPSGLGDSTTTATPSGDAANSDASNADTSNSDNPTNPAAATSPSASDAPATEPSAADKPKESLDRKSLFDGKTLGSWKVTNFGGEGEVTVEDGTVVMQQGSELTGITWEGDPFPKTNYELLVEAQKKQGNDFFCGLVFPVGDSFCSFVAGGWGGGVVGLSSVDGLNAAENQTASFRSFEKDRWYRFRLHVSDVAIRVWLDDELVVDQPRAERRFSLHPAVDIAKPLGICCFSTVAACRNMAFRALTPAEQQGGWPPDLPEPKPNDP